MLKLEGRRAGKSREKGWFIRITTGLVQQWNRGGAVARYDQKFDRDNDSYIEIVIIPDTGELVRHCDEALSKHTGHGSDKSKAK